MIHCHTITNLLKLLFFYNKIIIPNKDIFFIHFIYKIRLKVFSSAAREANASQQHWAYLRAPLREPLNDLLHCFLTYLIVAELG